MAGSDITVEILKDIRDDVRGLRVQTSQQFEGVSRQFEGVNQRLDVMSERLDVTVQRLDVTNQRLEVVESTLLDLAEQQRFVVTYAKAAYERDSRLEPRFTALETRVDKLEG